MVELTWEATYAIFQDAGPARGAEFPVESRVEPWSLMCSLGVPAVILKDWTGILAVRPIRCRRSAGDVERAGAPVSFSPVALSCFGRLEL